MLKKLRLRFVAVNMVIVLVILCTIFGVLLHATSLNLERETERMMSAIAADPLQLNLPDTTSRLPYFTVRISQQGNVQVNGTSYFDLTNEQVLSAIVTEAVLSHQTQGVLKDYSLRYLRTSWRGNEYVIFADISSANAASARPPPRCSLPSAFFWRDGRCVRWKKHGRSRSSSCPTPPMS